MDSTAVSYADDVCLLLVIDTWFNVKRIATVKVNKVFKILSEQKLTSNINKYFCYILHNKCLYTDRRNYHTLM